MYVKAWVWNLHIQKYPHTIDLIKFTHICIVCIVFYVCMYVCIYVSMFVRSANGVCRLSCTYSKRSKTWRVILRNTARSYIHTYMHACILYFIHSYLDIFICDNRLWTLAALWSSVICSWTVLTYLTFVSIMYMYVCMHEHVCMYVCICAGPEGSLYEGGAFHLQMTFRDGYPHIAPGQADLSSPIFPS